MMRVFRQATVCLILVAMLLSATACSRTDFVDSLYFIEAGDLAELMQDSAAVVLDARSAEDYAKGHLAGAINLPPDQLSVNEPYANLLAPQSQIENVLGNCGIGNDSKICVYDNNGGVNAGRVWWVLKVYGHDAVKVVNGGESAIVKAALPLSLDVPARTAVEYQAKEADSSIISTLDEVEAVVEGTSDAILLDVRSKAEYDEGAIPTARLYPHTKNLYNDNTFKSGRDTWLDYNDLGLKRDDAIILYCKTSFRATQTMIVLKEAGFTNVSVYDGAWVEWSSVHGQTPAPTPSSSVKPTVSDAS